MFTGKANMPDLDLFNVTIQSFYDFIYFFIFVIAPKPSHWLLYYWYYNEILAVINIIEVNKN